MATAKTKAPDQTLEEIRFLKKLVENKTPVTIKLGDNEVVSGVIEFYDANLIRVTRDGHPNLFVYKHDIKYLTEEQA